MNKSSKLSREKLMGIVTIILGLITLGVPLLVGINVLMLLGILVTTAGAMRMIWAVKSTSFDKGIWTFLLGVLTLLTGIAILAHPLIAGEMLAIFLIVYLAGDGCIEFIWGLTLQNKPGKAWLMMGGVMSILLAFILSTHWPIPAPLVIGVILGIKLVFIGLTMMKFETTLKSVVGAFSK